MPRSKKSLAVIAGATALVVMGGGVAFAYWTSSGTGTGTAQAGTVASLTVTQTGTTPSGLYPGGPSADLSVSVQNTGSSSVLVSTITPAVTGTTSFPTVNDPNCQTADWTVTGTTISPTTIAPGATVAFPNVATIALAETGVNQDACKTATATITYTVG